MLSKCKAAESVIINGRPNGSDTIATVPNSNRSLPLANAVPQMSFIDLLCITHATIADCRSPNKAAPELRLGNEATVAVPSKVKSASSIAATADNNTLLSM